MASFGGELPHLWGIARGGWARHTDTRGSTARKGKTPPEGVLGKYRMARALVGRIRSRSRRSRTRGRSRSRGLTDMLHGVFWLQASFPGPCTRHGEQVVIQGRRFLDTWSEHPSRWQGRQFSQAVFECRRNPILWKLHHERSKIAACSAERNIHSADWSSAPSKSRRSDCGIRFGCCFP